MPAEVIATVGASDANSYLSVEDADTEFDSRLGVAAWSNASEDDKARALLTATRQIDSNRLAGWRVTSTQRLEFPRAQQVQPLNQIPPEVISATLDQALELLQAAASTSPSRADLQAQGVVSFTTGSHSESFGSRSAYNGGLGAKAAAHLVGWISRTGPLLGPRDVERGPMRNWGPWT